jgi:hypothetical protein
MNDRGGEENCKAAANRLRKIPRVPAERILLSPFRAHATPRSNASFETKHLPPATFQESLSSSQRRPMNVILREENRARVLFVFFFPVVVGVAWSVLGEKLVLSASVVPGRRTLGFSQTHVAQAGGSMFALLLRDGAYTYGCKGDCYSRCHFRFDR